MAWKEVDPMEERIRFVLKAAKEDMTFVDLCDEFGISCKTGYKWFNRYQEDGLSGMHEHSRRPLNSPRRIEDHVEGLIVKERRAHSKWGPKKIRERIKRKHGLESIPAESTIGNIIKRNGLTRRKRRRRRRQNQVIEPDRTTRTEASRPNKVWTADFKGWFKTKDGRRCDPLTSTDLFSRYILICRVVNAQTVKATKPEFRRAFIRYGLPEVIRVDNGSPFGSKGVCGLTKLSAWWLQLGIRVEFIEPGHPEQNGSHERMHWTLKDETVRPPASNGRAQQRRFDLWRREFNYERPHEALDMQRPAQIYRRSFRKFTSHPTPPEYPLHYEIRMVRINGNIKWRNKLYYIGKVLHGMAVGLVGVGDRIYAVYFGDLLLGHIEEGKERRLRPPGAGDVSGA